MRRRRPLKIISFRNDDPVELALHWERTVIPELMHKAQYYKALLALKPDITRVIEIWFQQWEDFDLFVRGTADPGLWEQRKSALEERERSMAGLLQQIIELCEERGAKVN